MVCTELLKHGAQRGALRGLLAQSVLTAFCPSVWKLLHPHSKAGLVRLRCAGGSEDETLTGTIACACVRGLCIHIPPRARGQGGQAQLSSQQVEVQREVTDPGSHSN